MNDLIAKKYAKAISSNDIEEFYTNLTILNSIFLEEKFQILIQSNQIKKQKKLEFIFSFFDKMSPKFKNFLKLLVENSRLILIPQILKELQKQKALNDNTFLGVIYTQEKLDDSKIKDIQARLSAKFNVNIRLENQHSQNEGVKIALEELGYEISFSMKTIQNRMSEFVLKII